MQKAKQKIFVGVSGGVDSSVSAYLLKKEGHEVHGVFIKTWSPEWLPCTWIAEKRDAMRVCAQLDIPFHFLDAEEEYKKGVADYMIAEYKAGRTPNPDVLCNRIIKFGVLWDYAKSHGADAIATGHYARIQNISETTSSNLPKKIHSGILQNVEMIVRGKDEGKDQSYFLWMLRQDELEHISFPIGHLGKPEVRKIAQKAGLFTSSKKDSQGICFLGDVDMKEFLSHYIEQKPGKVIDDNGVEIGEHEGVWFYTIGERHGFTLTNKDSHRVRYYVTGKDIEKNILYVSSAINNSPKNDREISVVLKDVNWILPVQKNLKYLAQLRYHGKKIPIISVEENCVRLACGEEAIPLGQSLVIYQDGVMIGGGIVDSVLS